MCNILGVSVCEQGDCERYRIHFREQCIHTAVTPFLAGATILASGLKKLLQDSKGVDPFLTMASPSSGQRHLLQSRYSMWKPSSSMSISNVIIAIMNTR